MRARAKDKKNVKYLAVVGAVACASISVLVLLNEAGGARKAYQEQKSYVDRHMILMSFENTAASSNKQMIPAGMLEEAKLELTNRKSQIEKMETNFWITLSDWAFFSICAGTGLFAAAGGYCASWILSWITLLAMIVIVRGIFWFFRKMLPRNKSPYSEANSQNNRRRSSQRDFKHEARPSIDAFRPTICRNSIV
jgi:hypothetical protein